MKVVDCVFLLCNSLGLVCDWFDGGIEVIFVVHY